jgi:CDP-4-dehydro-6-deoxyglucose reductase/ferredoxin-NAD(P)+ reductase (naphthalene dioxygenase ferredoxin-specific)
MRQIQIQQWPQPVPCGPKQTVLEAALAEGVPFPHQCMSGECGQCKSKLLCGEVEHGAHLPDALSAAERAQGLVLACRARPKGPVQVEWLLPAKLSAAVPPVRRLRTRVEAIDRLAHDVVRLRLSPQGGKPLHFLPGQFAQLRIGKLPARSYSMANLPGDERLEFHVRVVPHGRVSQHVAHGLRVGDEVQLQGPFGAAVWRPEATPAPLLLAAGGTGLAPLWSVLQAALASGQRDITLYHGVRDERDLYAHALLSDLQAKGLVRYVPVLSMPSGATRHRTGWLHDAIAADQPELRGRRVYAAGPPPMVDAVRALAVKAGVPEHEVFADAFHAAPPAELGVLDRLKRLFSAREPAVA